VNNKNSSKAGFTLLEILIAVLIIGVLTTIALPMYQGAVDKSKWARLIAPARAVSTAQEAAFMNYGGYTANMDDLDVSLPEGNDMTYTLYTTTNGDDANFIRIVSSQLNDVRLAKYYKNNEGFEDQLYCEAKNGNDRANKLCGKLLKGEDLTNTDDGYKMYLIDDAITKPLCDRVSLWWSNNFTHCYKTEEDRCTANSMPYGGGLCGWTDTKNKTVNEGGKCESTASAGCQNTIVNDGGVCEAFSLAGCSGSTINDGGKCIAGIGDYYAYGCQNVKINNGGECIAQPGSGQQGNGCQGAKIYNGGKCTAETGSYAGCADVSVYDGGVCDGKGVTRGAVGGCYRVSVYDGGVCLGNEATACAQSRFYDGAVCEGNASGACNGNYANTWKPRFESGSTCNANVAGSCKSNAFMAGSTCNGKANNTCTYNGANFAGTCNGYAAGSCGTGKTATSQNITFTDGAVCNGHVSGSCKGIFDSGSRCVANVAGACTGTYQNGGCCEGGDNCPANAPRC